MGRVNCEISWADMKYVYGHGIESVSILLQIKQKQKGSDRKLMPSVEGQQAGKWVVIDSGSSNISYFHPSHFVNFNL